MENIEKILEDRGEMYGKYADNCALSFDMAAAWRSAFLMNDSFKCCEDKALRLCASETSRMILHKLARIANGQANQPDSWADIAGYATLMVRELERIYPKVEE